MSTLLRNKVRRSFSKLKLHAQFACLALSGNPVYTSEVNLEEVLIGEQCGTPLEKWVERTHEWDRASCLLADSPYVIFLQTITEDENRLRDDGFLEAQPYYQMARIAVEFTGSYFGARTPEGIKRQMHAFYENYLSIREGRHSAVHMDNYQHSAEGELLLMSKIKDSTCYELSDGHHRAAINYMLGKRKITVQVFGQKTSYLQRLVRQSNEANKRELDQPVENRDVRGWAVRQRCSEQLELICDFLDGQDRGRSIQTVLDVSCGYGWFVDQLQSRGLDAEGITPVAAHLKIGRIAYGLTDDAIRCQEATTALQHSNKKQDLVLSLNDLPRYALKERPEDNEFLRQLDGITGRILILDYGHEAAACSHSSLPGKYVEYIRTCILQHTTFKQVVPLGRDNDGHDAHEGQFQRTLFACIR